MLSLDGLAARYYALEIEAPTDKDTSHMKNAQRLIAATVIVAAGATAGAQSLNYPVTRKVDQVDVYHGVKVADPYRWLEDDNSAATAAWVEAENQVTFPYLEAIPFRQQMQQRVRQVSDYAK